MPICSGTPRQTVLWLGVVVLAAAAFAPCAAAQSVLSKEDSNSFVVLPSELGLRAPARLCWSAKELGQCLTDVTARRCVLKTPITLDPVQWPQSVANSGGVAHIRPADKPFVITSEPCLPPGPCLLAPNTSTGQQHQQTINFQQVPSMILVDTGARLLLSTVQMYDFALPSSYRYSSSQPYRNTGPGALWPTVAQAPNSTLLVINSSLLYFNPSTEDDCATFTQKRIFAYLQLWKDDLIAAYNDTTILVKGPLVLPVAVQDASNSTIQLPIATLIYRNSTLTCLPNNTAAAGSAGPSAAVLGPAIAVPIAVVLVAGCLAFLLWRRRSHSRKVQQAAAIKASAAAHKLHPQGGGPLGDLEDGAMMTEDDSRPSNVDQGLGVMAGPSSSISTPEAAACTVAVHNLDGRFVGGAYGGGGASSTLLPFSGGTSTASAMSGAAAAAAGLLTSRPPTGDNGRRSSSFRRGGGMHGSTQQRPGSTAYAASGGARSSGVREGAQSSGGAHSSGGFLGSDSGGVDDSGGVGAGPANFNAKPSVDLSILDTATRAQALGTGTTTSSSSRRLNDRLDSLSSLLKNRSDLAVLRDLKIGPCLGRGSYGRVYRGRWKATPVAVKIIEHRAPGGGYSSGKAISAGRETLLATSVSHPNVVTTYHISTMSVSERSALASNWVEGGGSTSNSGQHALQAIDNSVRDNDGVGSDHTSASSNLEESPPDMLETWIIMEFCSKGSLEKSLRMGRFKRSSDAEVVGIYKALLDTASGLDYLHSIGVVHGDLKTANVLLTGSTRDARGVTCKITDFGLSRVMDMNASHISTGTYGTIVYMPKELLLSGRMTQATDIYSFGLMMWEMITSERVLSDEGLSVGQMFYMIAYQDWRPELPPDCPPGYAELMTACWHDDPGQRPTAQQLLRRLQRLYAQAKQQYLAARQADAAEEL